MGGGNGLKSHMARQKNQEKLAAQGKGGGGASGTAERTVSKLEVRCSICKTPFTSAKHIKQLQEHHSTKHAKSSFADCFPGISV
jgi:hypothetical protein